MTEPETAETAPLRLGIIGAGALSSAKIYPCLHYLPIRLAAVCDLDESLARRTAAAFGGEHVEKQFDQARRRRRARSHPSYCWRLTKWSGGTETLISRVLGLT